MNEFENYLEFLGMIGNSYATRSALEQCKHGFFAKKLGSYVECGILRVQKAPDSRDDKFFLTAKGRALFRQEIRIDEIKEEDKNETAYL